MLRNAYIRLHTGQPCKPCIQQTEAEIDNFKLDEIEIVPIRL